MERSVAERGKKRKRKIRKTEEENNRRSSVIYCRFIESLATLVFLKNLSFRCFRHGALEKGVLCFCSGVFPNCGVEGSLGSGPVPGPKGRFRVEGFALLRVGEQCFSKPIWTVAATHALETLEAAAGKTHTLLCDPQ